MTQRSGRQAGSGADPGPGQGAAPPAPPAIADQARAIAAGDRRALARAITLVESSRPDHRAQAESLLAALPPRQALRLGLSGTPGVGKSTFVESLGMRLTGQGLRVAVLAVDPSSARTGGSILGDKTRMDLLSRDPRAFIRPSPAGGALGGVARRTRDAVTLCEAAGFDVVIVETVGVGQSETLVAGMTDVFLLLLAPGGGDELQGVKRGIMEMADIIAVNKADGDQITRARATAADYAGALHLLRRRPQDPEGYPRALTVSAVTGEGIDTLWQAVADLAARRRASGIWDATRAAQARTAFLAEVQAELAQWLSRQAGPALDQMAARVAAGEIAPSAAARAVLAPLTGGQGRP